MKNRHMFGKSSIINRPSSADKINYVPGSGVGAISYSVNRRKNIDAVNIIRNTEVYIRETYTIPEGTT